ncbi:hypothetical protein BT96DRAFT_934033 [Gymnopus androsaceus JB14]|uniref:Uncharacterized protein n=1 Tax=Gymnopus androsaceus JB14 TaxID=1447944 RepID=A0A6A4IBT6_9AGAR|nr:hypothetical protein BT96DRAFT_934033 [Gymnopus androsaceus JB14]
MESDYDNNIDNNTKPKCSKKLLNFVKAMTKATTKTVRKVEEAQKEDGLSVFRGKWEGRKGMLTSLVAFLRLPGFLSLKRMKNEEKEKEVLKNPAKTVLWSLAIDGIREVRKVTLARHSYFIHAIY